MKFVRINGENHAGYALLDIVEHKTSSMTVAEPCPSAARTHTLRSATTTMIMSSKP